MTRRLKAGSDYDRPVTGAAITQRIRTESGSDRPNTQLGLNEYTGTGDDYSERKILGQSLPLTVLILCWDVPMFRIAQASLRDQAGLFHRGSTNTEPRHVGVATGCKSNASPTSNARFAVTSVCLAVVLWSSYYPVSTFPGSEFGDPNGV